MELRNDKTRAFFSRGKMKNQKKSSIPIGFQSSGQFPVAAPVREATVRHRQSSLPPTNYTVGTVSLVAILLNSTK